MIWIIAGIFLLLALGLLLSPLLRRRPPHDPGRADHERSVYLAQLADYEREREDGLISEKTAQEARLEIERRLLRADRSAHTAKASRSGARRLLAVALILIVPGLSLGLYAYLGAPQIMQPDAVSRSQAEAMMNMSPEERQAAIAGMVAQLAERMEKNPDDLQGWIRLAQAYRVMNRPAPAADALRRAIAIAPGRTDLRAALAEVLIESAEPDQPLPPEVFSLYRQILEDDPTYPDALWFMGLERLRAGDVGGAIGYWERLLAELEPGTPIYDRLSADLDALRQSASQ